MRQPERKQIGKAGQTAAILLFEQFGWGPVESGEHDLGTDLFVQLRDETGADLGLVLGVQVKTGNSWFSRPATVDGRTGWWYRETPQKDKPTHKQYWLNHVVPHILLVQTEDLARRVWVPLTAATIEDTGSGIRIFVPDQTLHAGVKDELIDLAASARARPAFEGEHWRFDVEDLDAAARVRHAMIVPRLVEPHRNRGTAAQIHWAEAVAICVRADTERWDEFAKRHDSVPSPQEARSSPDPGWRFASSIHTWVTTGSAEELEQLGLDALPGDLRAARAVALAIAWTLDDRIPAARALLGEVLEQISSPEDRAWLQVHLARTYIERGAVEEGVRIAGDAQHSVAASRADATTTAIQAAAVWTRFESTDLFDRDIAGVVTALDTTASWWIAETTASGLTHAANESFRAWSRDATVRLGGRERIHNELLAAELSAHLAGNHGTWRAHAGLRAIVDLTVYPNEQIAYLGSLDTLRRAGDDENLALALRRLRRTGPLDVLTEFADGVDLSNSTRTSIRADLAALQVVGSYCSADRAAHLIDLLLKELEGESQVIAQLRGQFDPATRMIGALIGLHAHFTPGDWDRITRWVSGLSADTSEIVANPLRRLLAGAPNPVEYTRSLLQERVEQLPADGWLARLTMNLLGPDDESDRSRLIARLDEGDLSALAGLPDLGALSHAEAMRLLALAQARVSALTGQASPGVVTGYAYDIPLLCAQLSCLYPAEADWEVLAAYLREPAVAVQQKRSVAKLLAAHPTDIPAPTRSAIADAAATAQSVAGAAISPFDAPIGGALMALELAARDSNHPQSEALRAALLAGSAEERQDLADLLGSASGPSDEQVLLALAGDSDDDVREHALASLSRRIFQREGDPTPLYRFLQRGEYDSRAIITGMRLSEPLPSSAAALVDVFLQHPSALIRSAAGNLAASTSAGT